MKADRVKANGIHYTPPDLAAFLAEAVAAQLPVADQTLEVLDPACGDGALLLAFSEAVPSQVRRRVVLHGCETDADALRRARRILADAGVAGAVLQQQDFLALEGVESGHGNGQLSLFGATEATPLRRFDVVIANPPYVRTQVLGAAKSQGLARRFDLTGRVDLYHAFARAMANVLKPGGVFGLLTSNRFLTVASGASLRRFLRTEFSLKAIYDLGDTKLFSAAVLPVIVVGTKQRATSGRCAFDRIYEHRGDSGELRPDHESVGPLDALKDTSVRGVVRTRRGTFRIERGTLKAGDNEGPWSLLTPGYQQWLECVDTRKQCTFDDVASIRVGIKTTADDVFIRNDWQSLPGRLQPEAELLRPLITHVEAERWIPAPPAQKVLYTHTIENGKRIPIRAADYPKAQAYLDSYRKRLSSRKYVIDAGRQWYEIWVPQNPGDWPKPKVVFPDICDEPRFCLDSRGAIVNGDCYWMTLRPGLHPDWLLLLLAVGNSSFVAKYYDVAFHNKLYAGRRRFMTQYVKKFPLPPLDAPAARRLVQLVGERVAAKPGEEGCEQAIDKLVWESFGLMEEASR